MTNDVYRRKTCRLCGGGRHEQVVPFKATPPADAFVRKERATETQSVYPLDMYFCLDCHHVQLLDSVNPEILFGNYTYLSGSSPGLVRHFSEYADMVIKRANPKPGSLVVDIGSNDGVLLKFFKEKGFKVLGVDPAKEIARIATQNGTETLPEFFTPALAKSIREKYGPASVITANNVFAHADDMQGMIEGIRDLLAPDGVFVFEASYVVDVVEKMLLGSIFHEHLCYHAVEPLQSWFAANKLELVDVERVTIQGGSIIGFVRKKEGNPKVAPVVGQLIAEEKRKGFNAPGVYKEFSKRINALRDDVRALLSDIKNKGGKVAGFGAARGGTTLIYHFGLGDFLDYIVDDNPEKHFLFSPGLHIPVLPSDVIYEKKPDFLFLLAWVHAKPIMEKHQKYITQGGRFIIAHPTLEVVPGRS